MGKQTNTPNLVNVELLHYKFQFKKLTWREELSAKVDKGKDPVREILAYALCEVSGIQPTSVEESKRVITAIPTAIVTRVWKVYKGSFPLSRMFSTSDLYQAPELTTHIYRALKEESEEERSHDQTIRVMEAKFGKQEVAEEVELSQRILESAQKSGRVIPRATPERETNAHN